MLRLLHPTAGSLLLLHPDATVQEKAGRMKVFLTSTPSPTTPTRTVWQQCACSPTSFQPLVFYFLNAPPAPSTPSDTHTHTDILHFIVWHCGVVILYVYAVGRHFHASSRMYAFAVNALHALHLREKKNISEGNTRPQPHWPARHSTT